MRREVPQAQRPRVVVDRRSQTLIRRSATSRPSSPAAQSAAHSVASGALVALRASGGTLRYHRDWRPCAGPACGAWVLALARGVQPSRRARPACLSARDHLASLAPVSLAGRPRKSEIARRCAPMSLRPCVDAPRPCRSALRAGKGLRPLHTRRSPPRRLGGNICSALRLAAVAVQGFSAIVAEGCGPAERSAAPTPTCGGVGAQDCAEVGAVGEWPRKAQPPNKNQTEPK